MQIKTCKSRRKLVLGDLARFYLLFAQGCERMFGGMREAQAASEDTTKIAYTQIFSSLSVTF